MLVDYEQIKYHIRNKNYQYIGSGSGRMVYDLGNGYVVKVAKNKRGLAQNAVEYRIATTEHLPIFAKAHSISDDDKFLIMVKANKIKDISEVWKYFHVKNNMQLFQLKELKNILSKYQLIEQDFYRPTNWGMIRGRPVIVDYGFTWRVRKRYY